MIGEFSDFHAYVEEIMERPVFTHELPSTEEELRYKSKKDFMSIKIEEKEDKKKYDAEHYDPYKYARTWIEEYEKGEQSNPPEFLAKCMNIRVPDCNDCGYLNYTEKEQRDYGINSYKKDHRCKCYDRPVYHITNSANHDPYIYPCDECREDNFVNYYDCESSKKGE